MNEIKSQNRKNRLSTEDRKKLWADVLNLQSRNEAAFRRADMEPDPRRREFLHSEAMNGANSSNGYVWAALDRLAAEAFNR